MNILFIAEYFPPIIKGGGEINLFLLAKALVKRKITVHVLTSSHKRLKRFEEVEGIKIYRRLKTGSTPNSFFGNLKRSFIFPKSIVEETTKLNKEVNVDRIHFIGSSIISAPRLKKLRIPLIATIESYIALCPKGDRVYYEKRQPKGIVPFSTFFWAQLKSSEIGKMKNKFYLRYNPVFLFYTYKRYRKLNKALYYCKLIAISKYMQDLLAQHNLQSTVIPNAFEIEKFYSKKQKPGKIKISYFGSFTKFKGPHILLQAIKGINCRCDLYGEGIMKDELQNIINKHNLDAEIHPYIPYDKVPDLYAETDIVVFPSLWPEPFGRIAIEAMAAGKPVIGSAVGAIKETIEAGILVKPGNINNLREAIKQLIKNEKLRRSLGQKGRKIAQEKYSEQAVIPKLINLYKKIK